VDLMRAINEQEKTTFIFSTHDEHIMEHARRIVSLRDGLVTGEKAKG
jgi:putative ABC transport system ATP-binding protein